MLFEVFGHEDSAPVNYGCETCSWQVPSQPKKKAPNNNPTLPATFPLFPTLSCLPHRRRLLRLLTRWDPYFQGDSIFNENGHNYVVFITGQENVGYSNWEVIDKLWKEKVAEWFSGKKLPVEGRREHRDCESWLPVDRLVALELFLRSSYFYFM
jgi:hypothetical protein